MDNFALRAFSRFSQTTAYTALMSEISRSQAREIDRVAMEDWGLPGIVLMENAARGIAEFAASIHPLTAGRIALVCGPGNNGGDGYAAARHLANLRYDVEIQLPAPISSIDPESDAGINLLVARRMGIPMLTGVDVARAQFVIDALFGTGLSRTIGHPYLAAISAINAHQAPVLSIDIPSGLDADDGSVHGAAIRADWTATMVAPKQGFSRGKGPELTGSVRVIDIGVPRAVIRQVAGDDDAR